MRVLLQHTFSSNTLSEVLATLKNLTCPPPLKQIVEEQEPNKKKKPQKKANKKKGKKQGSEKTKKCEAGDSKQAAGSKAKAFGSYVPGEYNQKYHSFVARMKEEGHSHKTAVGMWHESQEKWDLLAAMPTPEKRRRRFA